MEEAFAFTDDVWKCDTGAEEPLGSRHVANDHGGSLDRPSAPLNESVEALLAEFGQLSELAVVVIERQVGILLAVMPLLDRQRVAGPLGHHMRGEPCTNELHDVKLLSGLEWDMVDSHLG